MASEVELAVDRGSGVPLAAQLTAQIRDALREGALAPGERLPSVRALAESASVNVNTVRAVYTRLESEGVVRSEQGRGTFVAGPRGDEAETRRALRRQIAQLEAELVRLPPRPVLAAQRPRRDSGAALLSTEQLEAVRDELVVRLRELDAERATVLERLGQLGFEEPAPRAPPRRGTPSLAGVRIKWVGA
jgi:GntR family transcriptional regulator